jgi:hypothetical protein
VDVRSWLKDKETSTSTDEELLVKEDLSSLSKDLRLSEQDARFIDALQSSSLKAHESIYEAIDDLKCIAVFTATNLP